MSTKRRYSSSETVAESITRSTLKVEIEDSI